MSYMFGIAKKADLRHGELAARRKVARKYDIIHVGAGYPAVTTGTQYWFEIIQRECNGHTERVIEQSVKDELARLGFPEMGGAS